MPALQIDGVHLAELDAEDALILLDLARRGRGRLVLPPMVSDAKPEPLFRRGAVVVMRTDWIVRLCLSVPEDTANGQRVDVSTLAANENDAPEADCAACGSVGPAGQACGVCEQGRAA